MLEKQQCQWTHLFHIHNFKSGFNRITSKWTNDINGCLAMDYDVSNNQSGLLILRSDDSNYGTQRERERERERKRGRQQIKEKERNFKEKQPKWQK